MGEYSEQKIAALELVVQAAREDVADAKYQCGGDGEGCVRMRGRYPKSVERRWRKCGQCPMDAMISIIEALDMLDGVKC